jgi:HEAT repeat protein
MRQARAAVAALIVLASPLAAAPPPTLTNARLESRSAAASLSAAVKAATVSRSGPLWIGWAVPAQGDHDACCWSSAEDPRRGGCRLEARGDGVLRRPDGAALRLERSRRLHVLLRAESGRVQRIRAYSENCALDASGLAFLWLDDVRPAESVSLLATFAGRPDGGSDEDVGHGALAAIAFHADPAADATLEKLVQPREPLERRQQAAFWLGQARAERGHRALVRLVRQDEDPRFRERAVFALSQSREPGAVETILEVARKDRDAGVRGQALFWLAQTAAARARGAIEAALDADPDVAVKKQAVFALSQLPRDEGVPLLIGLARAHKSHEVREQAMFWLGQSGDPRALAFFEEVLGR